ncbi:uncharacterized protein LOC130437046 [Triplophysa dalaica]|uniref:uncharacterized protein LOC130437046 n=1 Tax=Triplophysa dalaica TaxID=1582913 RepID=UPI0024DF4A32|nr:uncharacterized protein LOC130437046 [Triplophysa dalaica]
MGQKVCKCVEAESADVDRRDMYTVPENPPVQSTADSSDQTPPPAGATEGDVVHDRDGGRKKRRFWRKFWRKRSQDEREEHTIHQNTSAPSTADALDPSPPPAADIHEEEDENKDEGKKKKKRGRFWKRLWRKSRREEESDRSPEDQIQHNLETPELLNEDVNVFYEINSCQYEIGELLSKAGNTSVYEATRVSDGLKVAVKIVKDKSPDLISIPGHPYVLQREIGLHMLANEGEHVPEIIRLLDWEERYCEYIMVLERPSPCMDLFKFMESRRGKISEDLARNIMRQVVKALTECFKRGVFHMDFILENFLINTETLNVKLIDFSRGDLLKETCYTKFLGHMDYWCPELEELGEYHAMPATVWALGLMLYVMMFWALPCAITREQINNHQWERDDLSPEFCRFINACLPDDPHQRIQLKDLLLHEWFQGSSVEMIDSCFEGVSEDQMQETPELLNETDDLTEAGDLLTSHHSSVFDSSDEEFYTPALSLFDLCVNAPQRTDSSGSDSESIDSFHSTVGSVSDLLENNGSGNVIYKINSCQYKMGKRLGKGGFGSVYEATRVSDGLKVAVKFVRPDEYSDRISIPGHPNPLPGEIALHILANEGAKLSEIIQLLDWEDRDDKYIMVLEYPSPCMDLRAFIECHGGAITEKLAKSIMRQAIQAAIECFKRGVFHRDMKLENFLINTETFEVKLIDFGCGDLLKKRYTTLTGTLACCCPEMLETDGYQALPATVWSLGLILYRLVCGKLPEKYILYWINDRNWCRQDLTKECCRFISACLQQDPDQRIQIKDILFHEWFQV